MLNIAICDDDIQTTGRMDMLLQKIAKRNFMDVEIEVFWNGKSLADAVAKGTYFEHDLFGYRNGQRRWDFGS